MRYGRRASPSKRRVPVSGVRPRSANARRERFARMRASRRTPPRLPSWTRRERLARRPADACFARAMRQWGRRQQRASDLCSLSGSAAITGVIVRDERRGLVCDQGSVREASATASDLTAGCARGRIVVPSVGRAARGGRATVSVLGCCASCWARRMTRCGVLSFDAELVACEEPVGAVACAGGLDVGGLLAGLPAAGEHDRALDGRALLAVDVLGVGRAAASSRSSAGELDLALRSVERDRSRRRVVDGA